MTDPKHARPSFRNSFVAFSLFLMSFYWLVVASYPAFFIFNPFDDSWIIRQGTLLISLIGWIAISTYPAVALIAYAIGNRRLLIGLPIVALVWPISVVINQILLNIRDGVWYFDYLVNFPIFIATDILMPILVLFLWSELREQHGKHEVTQ